MEDITEVMGKWGLFGALAFVFIKWVLPFLQNAVTLNSSRSDAAETVYNKQSESLEAAHKRLDELHEKYAKLYQEHEDLRRAMVDLEIQNINLLSELERKGL